METITLITYDCVHYVRRCRPGGSGSTSRPTENKYYIPLLLQAFTIDADSLPNAAPKSYLILYQVVGGRRPRRCQDGLALSHCRLLNGPGTSALLSLSRFHS
jgi:hypothetical protein